MPTAFTRKWLSDLWSVGILYFEDIEEIYERR